MTRFAMSLPAENYVQINFKIKPTVIPSAAIKKLQSIPHGSGGLGDVWKCSMSTSSGIRLVAVKSIRIQLSNDSELLRKAGRWIRRETYVWTQLSHDHVLPFEGITDGFGPLFALVSLWMDNGTLNDYLKREFRQLTDHRKLVLIQQVAAGVSYLHGKDIVHGDLTGTNILVDGSGYIRIADFGLSMILAEAENEIFSELGHGALRWMAPEFLAPPFEYDEELKPTKPTKAGDIYSFGCVMLQILSGKEPYAWIKTATGVIRAVIRGENPFRDPINIIGSHRDLSSQCFSREPEVRPSTIEIIDIVSPVGSENSFLEVISISTAALNACITGDLPLAENLLTQEIDGEANNYNSYANRAFVMARKCDWDRALHDALKSVSIQPSLIGYISKGISLCGKMDFQDATKAFDVAFMFTNGDSRITHLLLIKAIALFNANQHQEAMSRIEELITVCPKADIRACHVVKAYLHVQLGVDSLDHNEAADHFTTAVQSIFFSSKSDIHSQYETFVVIFGWDLKSLWKTANQKRCHALLRAGRITEALKSHQYMMVRSDRATRASCLDWSAGFKRDCSALYAAFGDTSLTAGNHDQAIKLYSAAINLDSATDTIFANRSKAKLEKLLWEDALVDAQKVIELNPSSYLGYQLKHAALDGTQRYDEAFEAFKIMLSKLDNAPDAQTRELRQQYVSLSEAEDAIRKAIDTQLENTPPRLLNTTTGRLCDREAQINAFNTSTEFKMLLSYTIKHAELGSEHIQERIRDVVATYFRYAMLSHRWTRREPLLKDVQDKAVYELDPVGGISKLQSFCKTALSAGFCWAWSDTCCIDKSSNVEVQESVNTMFVWYSHSALTIIYLSDVMPSSKSGALARSAWNKRGWTVQEFLAPETVLFYQEDWTLYLDDRSPKYKESVPIMQELGDATGIDARALIAFRPGMEGARDKLQWSSMRITTLQEDMAYSLFGIFGVHLPVIYGEKKQNALGRLLQEIVARSGDISALDWVGKSSKFNSCLPADINSYKALPHTLPSLSEDQIQVSISSLRNLVAVDLASKLYNLLDSQSVPRFFNCRLQLPCIVFRVTEIRGSRARDQKITYEVEANGLINLSIITEAKLLTRQTLLLVRPWNRYLLESPDMADDTQIVDDDHVTDATGKDEPSGTEPRWRFIDRVRQPVSAFFDSFTGPVDSESHLRALRLIVRLGQPFRAFLLAQQRGGEYRRIASDYDIIARVQDMTSVHNMSDVRIIEIL